MVGLILVVVDCVSVFEREREREREREEGDREREQGRRAGEKTEGGARALCGTLTQNDPVFSCFREAHALCALGCVFCALCALGVRFLRLCA